MLKSLQRINPAHLSIRWRLPLSYAAIAMLTALVLGGSLLLSLNLYYDQQEQEYLQENADALDSFVMRIWTESDGDLTRMTPVLEQFSFMSDTRLRLLSQDESLVVDTGFQDTRRQFTVSFSRAEHNKGPNVEADTGESVEPSAIEGVMFNGASIEDAILPQEIDDADQTSEANAVSFYIIDVIETDSIDEVVITSDNNVTGSIEYAGSDFATQATPSQLYPFAGQSFPFLIERRAYGGYSFDAQSEPRYENVIYSEQAYTTPLYDEGQLIGYLELSGGPALGITILQTVRDSLLLASLLAVMLAMAVGVAGSRTLTQPLQTIVQATEKMADGQLDTRVSLERHDELGVLAASFNNMTARVSHTVDTLKRFVADAAHEIQTPITAIRTNLELSIGDEQEQNHYINQAMIQLARLSQLTEKLLNLARIESQEINLKLNRIDLASLLRQVSETHASRAEQSEVEFMLTLPDCPAFVEVDESQLLRVIDNLLDNALKFTPVDGTVHLKLETSRTYLLLSVEDTGIGIPHEDQPYLFSRFRRASNAAAYPGSGLGLVLARHIVEAHGGTISFESQPSQTRFTIMLPYLTSGEGNNEI